jgi:methionyl aminopeptidase
MVFNAFVETFIFALYFRLIMSPKEAYLKAGKIHAEICKKARDIVKPGAKLLDVTKQIEAWIAEYPEVSLAFPVNLQINEKVHYTSPPNDETVFKDDDLVKVDIGIHVEGYIADGAFTVTFDPKFQDMVDFTEETLMKSITGLKPGMPLSEIGRRLDESVNNSEYNIVRNLMGHQLDQWDLHSRKSVFVYENKENKNKMEPGDAFAIEIFITDGKGWIRASSTSVIFSLKKQTKPVRDAKVKKLLKEINDKRKHFPFGERYVVEHLGYSKLDFFNARRTGNLQEYAILVEKPGSRVAQFEHVIYVDEDEVIITTKQ